MGNAKHLVSQRVTEPLQDTKDEHLYSCYMLMWMDFMILFDADDEFNIGMHYTKQPNGFPAQPVPYTDAEGRLLYILFTHPNPNGSKSLWHGVVFEKGRDGYGHDGYATRLRITDCELTYRESFGVDVAADVWLHLAWLYGAEEAFRPHYEDIMSDDGFDDDDDDDDGDDVDEYQDQLW